MILTPGCNVAQSISKTLYTVEPLFFAGGYFSQSVCVKDSAGFNVRSKRFSTIIILIWQFFADLKKSQNPRKIEAPEKRGFTVYHLANNSTFDLNIDLNIA